MAGSATHILVIDDDQAIREMLALALGEAGHRVTLSGGGALEAINDMDVAVMDIRLGRRIVGSSQQPA
jgi:two-component system OmpR family response regulator